MSHLMWMWLYNKNVPAILKNMTDKPISCNRELCITFLPPHLASATSRINMLNGRPKRAKKRATGCIQMHVCTSKH
ncbi:uncharacterized protein PgNI_08412 [Pyricularia grisea]|uniref:Uncharacterized protein n=1 Tax=Pyricularia grisea TaxID=148305 RepID=A0A6P8AUK0_PYRGI|nr:uncharacterized protein PgNI_08412 [Pyricularia grisea]TLD05875.1 hypothetical protein PgNI_08412 [Pyricularia grisea]